MTRTSSKNGWMLGLCRLSLQRLIKDQMSFRNICSQTRAGRASSDVKNANCGPRAQSETPVSVKQRHKGHSFSAAFFDDSQQRSGFHTAPLSSLPLAFSLEPEVWSLDRSTAHPRLRLFNSGSLTRQFFPLASFVATISCSTLADLVLPLTCDVTCHRFFICVSQHSTSIDL